MNGLPAGAAFGTLVHEVLEVVDTAAADLRAELGMRCAEAVSVRAARGRLRSTRGCAVSGDADSLGIRNLGQDRAERSSSRTRFRTPTGRWRRSVSMSVTLRGVSELLRRHLPADDILASYADYLDRVETSPMRGF